ncbi:MAG: acetolactate synthase large subunit [Pseudomonadota bacterium]
MGEEMVMNGADVILQTMALSGIDVVFTNPGTSEMQLVAALDHETSIRPVLGLFEGVCTGAADGYSRVTGKTGATLLHLGPGLANGLANVHNAKKAGTSVLNVVGDHATYHLHLDAPLTSDIAAVAAPMSHHVENLASPDEVASGTAQACTAAQMGSGQVSTLIVPADLAWSKSTLAPVKAQPGSQQGPSGDVDAAAQALRAGGRRAMLYLGNGAHRDDVLAAAGRIQAATGCRLAAPTFNACVPRGQGRAALEATPYFAELAVEFFREVDTLVLLGAKAPVAFFAYPDKPSILTQDGCDILPLARPEEACLPAAEALVEALGAKAHAAAPVPVQDIGKPSGDITPATFAAAFARHLPEGAVVADECISFSMDLPTMTAGCPAHRWMSCTGGAIGQGLSVAVGAAVGAPGQKVIAPTGDGSAMYTIQALWTMAREGLDVVVIIINNQAYNILQFEMIRTGANTISERAQTMLGLGNPRMDFCSMAAGMGLATHRAESAEALDDALAKAMETPGPVLIEAMV